MPRKYARSKRANGSVSGFQEVLPDTDEEDVPLLVEKTVKSTARHVTLTGDSVAASRASRRTRFTEETEVMLSMSEPMDEFITEDMSVPPEFETWLGTDAQDNLHSSNFEEGPTSSTHTHDDEHESSEECDDDANPPIVHDIADHVASIEAGSNKSQCVCLSFCLGFALR